MKNAAPVKVIIDTNLWISFLIGKRLGSLKQILVENQIELVLSEELLGEMVQVTQRPKLRRYFPEETVGELIRFLHAIGQVADSRSIVTRRPNQMLLRRY